MTPRYRKGDLKLKGQNDEKRELQSTQEERRVKVIGVVTIVSVMLIVVMAVDVILGLVIMPEVEAEVETTTPKVEVIADCAIVTETTPIKEPERESTSIVKPERENEIEPSELVKVMSAKYYKDLDDALEKLVLVDISEQHLWAFEAENVVLEGPVVTGMKDRYDTQLGMYSVILKREQYTMRGSYGTAKVDYWMRFNDPYAQGLHDAAWRDSATFGGDTYMSNGSHGCVNLPLEFAAELYSFVEVGTPVIVQK